MQRPTSLPYHNNSASTVSSDLVEAAATRGWLLRSRTLSGSSDSGGHSRRHSAMPLLAQSAPNSLEQTLTTPFGTSLFVDFSQQEVSAENIMFWMAVQVWPRPIIHDANSKFSKFSLVSVSNLTSALALLSVQRVDAAGFQVQVSASGAARLLEAVCVVRVRSVRPACAGGGHLARADSARILRDSRRARQTDSRVCALRLGLGRVSKLFPRLCGHRKHRRCCSCCRCRCRWWCRAQDAWRLGASKQRDTARRAASVQRRRFAVSAADVRGRAANIRSVSRRQFAAAGGFLAPSPTLLVCLFSKTLGFCECSRSIFLVGFM